ncbi:MAG TPA: class I SAM-dependent methyltransferase [Dehalococcoidia bacterium]|nr:class I SAM-dependent methyltransferase [Dehalococcoidia bacterium]
MLVEFAEPRPGEIAVDIGTGAGFTAGALAAQGARVVAVDPTVPMLERTRELAVERGLAIALVAAQGEALPFADGSFDIVACRLACHHFPDLQAALREFRRIVRPDGRVAIADTTAPEDPELDAWMNDVELRRDPTHVRDRRPSEWRALLREAGFRIERDYMARSPQEFEVWVSRAGTAADAIPGLRRDFERPPAGAVDAFGMRHEGGTIRWAWDNYVTLARPV